EEAHHACPAPALPNAPRDNAGRARGRRRAVTLPQTDALPRRAPLRTTGATYARACVALRTSIRFRGSRIEPDVASDTLARMKPTLLFAATVLLSSSIGRPTNAPAAPCTAATTACEQWITYGSGPARSMVYSTYSLTVPNAQITRALIMVHGAGRNADHYFQTATAAAFLAGALENTIVIAPHFIAERDTAAPNEVLWPERGDTWRSGGMSPTNPTLSSFDFMDEILRRLADKKVFPSLTKIVVAGHSAGGQFATRYEMANKVHGTLGVSVSYVVANPSSYAWPVAVRPLPEGDADPATALKAPLGKEGE